MVREFGLSEKQRKAISEYSEALGENYVRTKAELVREQPRRNGAGALLAALRDDWQPAVTTEDGQMRHIKDLLDQATETLAIRTNTVISASTKAAIEFDFEFETFGEKKLCEMLIAAESFVSDMAIGRAPRWLSFLGQSGTGKTHLARRISKFFKARVIDHRSGNRRAPEQKRRIHWMA